MTVEFTREARQDILEAFLWYEQQRIGLGDEFTLCLDEARERMTHYPQAGQQAYTHYRRCLLRRFPYVLYYRLIQDRMIVVGVLHVKRQPQTIQERLSRNK